jgi:hypothetical protein
MHAANDNLAPVLVTGKIAPSLGLWLWAGLYVALPFSLGIVLLRFGF